MKKHEDTNDLPKFSILLVRLWGHLSPRRKRQFGILTVLMLISAFAEVVSLGTVLPFLGILMAPETVFKYPFVAELSKSWNIQANEMILPLTIAFASTALFAGVIRVLLLWVNTRLAFASGADLSMEVYRRTLYQPYSVHVSRNSSLVISGIIEKVSNAVSVLYQVLTLISSITLLVAITTALIVINPSIALITITCFGSSYGCISYFTRKQLRTSSKILAQKQTQVIRALQEGLGGIRDVLLDATQPAYCKTYGLAEAPLRHARGNLIFIAGSPRFAMEAFGMTMIAILAYAISKRGGVSNAVPVLGALALGAQRLLPALQQGYAAWSSIMGNHASLNDTVELLDQPIPPELLLPPPPPLKFQNSIQFSNVNFRYSDDSPWVLNGINLTLKKGERIGFVGGTGGGKSTTLDLLMGLLEPTSGEILIDKQTLNGKNKSTQIRAWQRNIAHVPQNIHLADATLMENIAFGIPREQIDIERVHRAAKQAQISEFIESRTDGYNSFAGERGIRLSGGQRQRIGIARALYKQANVLIFDEATSALDNITEESVMSAIEGLDRDLTILIIAHRLSTVRNCDEIIELEHGKVVAQGTYEQLLETSENFRKMAASKNNI